MKIIILGDKYQKRMKSRGCPGLIKTKSNKHIIQEQCDVINKIDPNNTIVYIGGFESKKIESFLSKHPQSNIELVINDKYEEYGDVYCLGLASEYLDDDTIIMFGHHILEKSMFKKIDKTKSYAFIDNNKKSDIGCIIDNDEIQHVSFDLSNRLNDMYFISSNDIEKLKTYSKKFIYRNYFIFEIFNLLIENKQIIMYPLIISSKKATKK